MNVKQTALAAALGLSSLGSAHAQGFKPFQGDSPPEKVLSANFEALALRAAIWGAPLVTMYALRYHDAVGPDAKAPPNAIWRMQDISTPELAQAAGHVTPNVNTLYGFGFLDLAAEPVILNVPDSHGRYYMVEIVEL